MKVIKWIFGIMLGGITLFLLLGFFGTVAGLGDEAEYYSEAVLEVHGFTLEKIGSKYQEMEADDGYSYYRMDIEVENVSHFTAEGDYLWRYYDAEYYEDVEKLEPDYQDIWRYENQEMIPAGRTAVLQDILLIRDGVDEVRVVCSANYDEEDQEYFIKVP